ncbi:hypothetical protein [Nakamurella lactea]|uniref:hypothetical protein n=1 Tax=Nakamurella lactea TaxID=459515 RepID=UPI000427CC41|nr:hypothetical protein [Nakamurella lactea]
MYLSETYEAPEHVGANGDVKFALAATGYVVVKQKSYRQSQEKQRIAEAQRSDADEQRRHNQDWVENGLFPRIRQLSDRCTYLYGPAARHGASDAELQGPAEPETGAAS